ncbi:creatininase family protein [Rhizobium halophytocola]|uniref:Creatinine amidohydrolase n=1 Tax=Rhizobium halophytocola TaxID=735519 RepID=A0ABS4DUI3_9HYPH|nr:creatininase family protein [Rhizobium halophytocola]MBP1849357.1 creatinine amidohydrolase [Rhizobium halophytocola]
MDLMDWNSLTRAELGELARSGALVVVPTGAIEQHGDHLGVDTDTRLATSVTRLAARQVSDLPIVVAPAVSFGFSPHHAAWPGTITLRLETYVALLHDIALSILQAGFPRVLFVNGHGGNEAPLRSLVTQMVTDGFPVGMINYFQPSIADWTPLLKGALARAGHACEQETALTLAIPETGAQERSRIALAIAGLKPRTVQPWMADGEEMDPITAAGAGWPPIFQEEDCGYYGDPAAATAQTGAAILQVTVTRLAAFFEDFAAAPLRVGARRGTAAVAGAQR